MRDVVIVGAPIAGLSAARSLRGHGFDSAIVLVGEEPYLPYQRPLLSKRLLAGEWDRARIGLRVPASLRLEWILGTRATSLNLSDREVGLDNGLRLCFDGLVIALIGVPSPADPIRVVEGALDERRFVALFECDRVVTAAILFNSMDQLAKYTAVVENAVRGIAQEVTS